MTVRPILGEQEKLRKAMPDISISTDIIVGFPGETEEDFEATLRMVERMRYDAAYTFIYSEREGTLQLHFLTRCLSQW